MMNVAIDTGKVFDLAKKIAANAADKYGHEFWTVEDCHIALARQQLATESGAPLEKRVAVEHDEELIRKAAEAQFARREPHAVGLGDPPHPRTEFGEIEHPELGRLRIAHENDGARDWLNIHGLHHEVGDLDLRQAIFATAQSFNRAETAEEQVSQRAVVGVIVSEVLHRNEWLNAKVRDRKSKERYD